MTDVVEERLNINKKADNDDQRLPDFNTKDIPATFFSPTIYHGLVYQRPITSNVCVSPRRPLSATPILGPTRWPQPPYYAPPPPTPPPHPILTTLKATEAGIAAGNAGDVDGALFCFMEALAIIKDAPLDKRVGAIVVGGLMEHPNLAVAYNNVGTAYAMKREYEKSVEYHLLALNIRRNTIHKKSHPNTMIITTTLGENSVYTAQSYTNLGAIYFKMQDYLRAIDCHKKALNIRCLLMPLVPSPKH